VKREEPIAAFRPSFALEFQSSKVTPDAGLLAFGERDFNLNRERTR